MKLLNNHKIEKEIKLQKLKDNFWKGEPIKYTIFRTKDYFGHEQIIIKRQTLKEMICGVLHITDSHTVNGWIDYLISLGILEHNPDSQRTRNGYIKPSNDTKYFLHYEKCETQEIDHTHRQFPKGYSLFKRAFGFLRAKRSFIKLNKEVVNYF